LGGRIVYENNNKEIMLINPDGSGRIKVTNGQSPIFAPDGKRLAFVIRAEDFETNPNAKDIMYTVNLDGSGRQEMCSGQNRQYLILSRWSPRDRFIAFGSVPRQTDGFPLIFLCNTTDKKANAGVKPSQGYASVFYDWTPDGENALWHVYETNSWGIYYGDPDKNGAGAVRLASLDDLPVGLPTPEYTSARFSPDGKTVAIMTYNGKLSFVSVPGQKSPLEGKVIDKLSERYSGSLAWSPDGKAIAFYEAKNNALRIIDVADQFGKVTTLATDVGGSLDWSRN
jgi:Tol biopolymer transport system component